MIDEAFAEEVRKLRDEGWTWDEVAEITGRAKRTCARALELREKTCKHKGCQEPVVSHSGVFCSLHAKQRMRNKPGQGDRQREVMRHMRRLGTASSAQLRTLTGMDSMSLGQVTGRLVKLGMIERATQGWFTMPRPEGWKPAQPIEPTPDRVGLIG